jgi:hypothetical protein
MFQLSAEMEPKERFSVFDDSSPDHKSHFDGLPDKIHGMDAG